MDFLDFDQIICLKIYVNEVPKMNELYFSTMNLFFCKSTCLRHNTIFMHYNNFNILVFVSVLRKHNYLYLFE